MATKLELLAPARTAGIAIDAIRCGADAVYMGAPAFGARAAACNSIDDLALVAEEAHRFNARLYATMNTILFDSELKEAGNMVRRLYDAGVDALIVQDMAYLKMKLPPIALHASTQCDTRTPAQAAWLEKAGFSQIVLARELTLQEIRNVRAATTVPLEAFVHGALCVCYSGDCQAGYMAMGRSANRGECPQMCRLPYRLQDASGRDIAPERHYLSLRDMQRIHLLADMADAGITSFKIEGRLKDAAYVRTTVTAYSAALDALVTASDGRYERASAGKSDAGFSPVLNKVFNRGYTTYFLDSPRRIPGRIASMASPKNTGVRIGVVKSSSGRSIVVSSDETIHNGDGLGYFAPDGTFVGFRANKVDGNTIHVTTELKITPGTPLYRNSDKAYNNTADRAAPERTIEVKMHLRAIGPQRIALRVRDERGNDVERTAEVTYSEARTPQHESRRRCLEKLGGSIYTLNALEDSLGDRFVPASTLTSLRREALDALDRAQRARYTYDRRCPNLLDSTDMQALTTSYHNNIANRLAESVYIGAGARIGAKAVEVSRPQGETVVMTTRYCLRRELGACLLSKDASRLPRQLFLRAPGVNYRLDFDCANCEMKVVSLGKNPVLLKK